MKECPYCKELIEENLKVCPICCETLPVGEDKETIFCPYCAEPIDKNSVICPICEENLINPETLTNQNSDSSANSNKKVIIVWLLSIILICGLIFGLLYKKTDLSSLKNKIAVTRKENSDSKFKNIPWNKRAAYKNEIENYLDISVPRVKREYDNDLESLKDKYERLKNGQIMQEEDIYDIDGALENFDSPEFNLYKDLVDITNKYVDIKDDLPGTDFIGTLVEFVHPYLEKNKVNDSKLKDLSNYGLTKYKEAEKYVNLIHKIIESPEYKDRKRHEIDVSDLYKDTNDVKNFYPRTDVETIAKDWDSYMRELQRRIKMNWDPPKGNESKRVVLLFKIAKDGRLLSVKVSRSSGVQAADRAAVSAVELTAPFQPLPLEFKGQSVDVQFTFDYNVFGASRYVTPEPVPPAPRQASKVSVPNVTATPKSAMQIPVSKNDAPKLSGSYGGPVTAVRAGNGTNSATGTGMGTGRPAPSFAPSAGGSSTGRFSNENSSSIQTSTSRKKHVENAQPRPDEPVKEPDFGPYMRELKRRIKMNWDPPKGDESKRIVVLFKVAKNGELLSVKVQHSSGVPAADKAAVSAVELTAPFKPLPPEFKGQSVDIEFTFDYNVFGASRY